MIRTIRHALLACIAITALAGCESDYRIGHFQPGPVYGLRYATKTLSGYTTAKGEFEYLRGQTVNFYVGDILIGSAKGAETVTLFDLVGITTPPLTASETLAAELALNSGDSTPFRVVTNISILLQTLDMDGEPANGVTIPYAVTGASKNITLDFTQTPAAFKQARPFRQLIAYASSAGAWSRKWPAIRDTDAALDALYSGLGYTPDLSTVSKVEYDTGADGNLDWTYTYSDDAAENLTRFESDAVASDLNDYVSTTYYNSNNDYIRFETDYANSTSPDISEAHTFYGGLRISTDVDSDNNGTTDKRYLYTYNTLGDLIKTETDDDANEVVDRRTEYTINSDGNDESFASYVTGTDAAVSKGKYTYSGTVLTRYEVDSDADGDFDYSVILSEPAPGVRRINFDTDNDGNIDKYTDVTKNSLGLITLVEDDRNGDDVVDYRRTYVYADDLLIRIETDSDVDGTPDHLTHHTWQVVHAWSRRYGYFSGLTIAPPPAPTTPPPDPGIPPPAPAPAPTPGYGGGGSHGGGGGGM